MQGELFVVFCADDARDEIIFMSNLYANINENQEKMTYLRRVAHDKAIKVKD